MRSARSSRPTRANFTDSREPDGPPGSANVGAAPGRGRRRCFQRLPTSLPAAPKPETGQHPAPVEIVHLRSSGEIALQHARPVRQSRRVEPAAVTSSAGTPARVGERVDHREPDLGLPARAGADRRREALGGIAAADEVRAMERDPGTSGAEHAARSLGEGTAVPLSTPSKRISRWMTVWISGRLRSGGQRSTRFAAQPEPASFGPRSASCSHSASDDRRHLGGRLADRREPRGRTPTAGLVSRRPGSGGWSAEYVAVLPPRLPRGHAPG
jgi:hypothetical protein